MLPAHQEQPTRFEEARSYTVSLWQSESVPDIPRGLPEPAPAYQDQAYTAANEDPRASLPSQVVPGCRAIAGFHTCILSASEEPCCTQVGSSLRWSHWH